MGKKPRFRGKLSLGCIFTRVRKVLPMSAPACCKEIKGASKELQTISRAKEKWKGKLERNEKDKGKG